ncbi:MAG: aminopeptidase P family protein [Acidimicrobiales bacterium]|nr:aminopeptidase P family protein [Acidimicrobiales bacterium]
MTTPNDQLLHQRKRRLLDTMRRFDVPALLTADPISILYATGARNMTVHGFTGPDRFVLLFADGPAILYEFAGCDHLAVGLSTIDEIRPAPGISAKKTPRFRDEIARFADELRHECRRHAGDDAALAVERIDFPMTDALRDRGLRLEDATTIVQLAMSIKQPAEMDAMRDAVRVVEQATEGLRGAIRPGATENEVWAEFHRGLIGGGGEFVVTRLLQSGIRTFPYFLESSDHRLAEGDLVCFDTDAMSVHGYSVDFSRTYLCGDGDATPVQRHLHALALEQLEHNSSNLAAGRSFEDFARLAVDVPEPYRAYGYYQLAHGLGLAGGHPNVPRLGDGPYELPGEIEAGMVLCVESYIGDPVSRQGVKLEDQFLVHADHVERMSTSPFDDRLSG